MVTFEIKQLNDGYWYLFIHSPQVSNATRMGGYATESNANEMKDFLARELNVA